MHLLKVKDFQIYSVANLNLKLELFWDPIYLYFNSVKIEGKYYFNTFILQTKN